MDIKFRKIQLRNVFRSNDNFSIHIEMFHPNLKEINTDLLTEQLKIIFQGYNHRELLDLYLSNELNGKIKEYPKLKEFTVATLEMEKINVDPITSTKVDEKLEGYKQKKKKGIFQRFSRG